MGPLIESDEDNAANVVVRLSEVVVLVHFAFTQCTFIPLSAYGLQGTCSSQTKFLIRCSSRAEQSDSLNAHFSVVRKSAAAPYSPLTATFLGFASAGSPGLFANGDGGHRPSLLVDMMPGPFDCSEDVVEYFMFGLLFEGDVSRALLRADGAFPTHSRPAGCRERPSRTEFLVRWSSRAEHKKVLPRTLLHFLCLQSFVP